MSVEQGEPLKIGYVLDDGLDAADGVQQYLLTIGGWMQEHGHEVHYLTGETKRTDIENVHSLARNRSIRFNGNRVSIPQLARGEDIRDVLTEHDFDVVHVQMPYSPMLGSKVIKAIDEVSPETSLVGTFHILPLNTFHTLGNKALGLSQRRSLRRFDEVVSVSEAAQAFAYKTYRIPSSVLPNVVDLDRFAKGQKREDMTGNKNIVFLGRLVPRKGCMELLQALSYLREQSSPALEGLKVTICGKGELKEKLAKYAEAHGLDTLVDFVGFVDEDDKPDYLASADIAVFPSLGGESFGIVLIEAMASGAVVTLGNNNPGYECVLGQWPEAFVDATDPEAFAKQLEHFLLNPEAAQELHKKQIEAVEQYDISVVGPKLVRMYHRAIAKRRHRAHN